MTTALFALAALVPAMVGPLPALQPDRPSELVARLCNGGTMVIPLSGRSPDQPAPCPQRGCHAGCSRKRLDPAQ